MIRKRVSIILIATLVSMLVLGACSKSSEPKYYDKDFMSSLEKGLESRWVFADKEEDTENKEFYTTATKKELEQVKKYEDLKFKDSKLKEAAISYINELKNGLKVAKTYGSDSFYDNWEKHYDSRTSKLITINDIKKIEVSEKKQSILDELLASGKEVISAEKNKDTLTSFLKSITFAKDETRSNEFSSYYTATVENTTGLNIENLNLSFKLIDDNGVTVDTPVEYVENWNAGEKRQLEFWTDKQFSKTEITMDEYFKIKE